MKKRWRNIPSIMAPGCFIDGAMLGNLAGIPLMGIATVFTAFNDNAAITLLSTLAPGFTDELKYAVMSGAVAGGGLTVIANAPNPAGQSILKKFFSNGVSAGKLLKASLAPSISSIATGRGHRIVGLSRTTCR